MKRTRAALFTLLFVSFAYFYQAGGWNQNSRFALVRAITNEHTLNMQAKGQKLRAGIIGCGLGASHGYAYTHAPEYELVAICDLKPELQQRFVDNWGSVWPNVRRYDSFPEMLQREQLDVLSVATPDHLHASFVIGACEAGVKGIFCEKPLATSISDARHIVAAVERHAVVMSVNHWTRWWPPFLQARDAVRGGAIGRLRRIVQSGGGPRAMMFRNGTYMVDAFSFFACSRWRLPTLDRATAASTSPADALP